MRKQEKLSVWLGFGVPAFAAVVFAFRCPRSIRYWME